MQSVNQTDLTEYLHEETFEHLANGDQIAAGLLDERDKAMELVGEILDRFTQLNTLMERYCPIRGKAFVPVVDDVIRTISNYSEDFLAYEEGIRKKIDKRYWRTLLDASRATTLMSASKKDELDKCAEQHAPPFTEHAVIGTLQGHYENRMLTFMDGAVELFQSLCSGFKSNDRICFRSKIILTNTLFSNGWSSFGSERNRVHDLERIFMILDGKDPADLHHQDAAPSLMAEAKRTGLKEFQHAYFKAKMFGNGNIHIVFTRSDLVDKLNSLLESHYGNSLGYRSAKF